MLTVKNTSTKIIGFGIEPILPDQTVTLPKGYTESHPTIKFYLNRGWLTKSSNAGVLIPTGTSHDATDAGETSQNNLSKRSLERMKIEDLKALAIERKLQIADNLGKEAIVKIIVASVQPGEPVGSNGSHATEE